LALAFGISWSFILAILATRGFDLSPMLPLEAGLILLAMLLGPSLIGLIATAILEGRGGCAKLARVC
jgi:hypothetical protein